MDLWVALAAAGASYVAKHWKNNLRDRESSSDLPSEDSNFVKPESPPSMGHRHDKSCLFQRLMQRKRIGQDVFKEREQASQNASSSDLPSTSGFHCEKQVSSENYEDYNVLSISSLSPMYLQNEDQVVAEQSRVNSNTVENSGDSFTEPSMKEMGSANDFSRNKISLRSRNMKFIKPLTSLESCLMAQLHKEHAVVDEYVVRSVPSPSSPTVRPFFVSDGRRIISRGGDSFSLQIKAANLELHKQVPSAENEAVFGFPPLSYVGSLEHSRMEVRAGNGLGRKSNSSSKVVKGKHRHSLAGSSHGALLFGLGLSVGLITSFLANKREVDKLNDLLKQTENLVQDLQDELEMKDSLTVKELTIGDFESQDTGCHSYNKRAPQSFSALQHLDGSTIYDGKELPDQKADEGSESMSKIEAELEAELERLELNMNSSSLEGRLSDLVELDPGFLPDVTRIDLRPGMFGRQAGAQPYADRDRSGTSTPLSANYAVSPRELSLRLHQVIQSSLEERVKELEAALENSQKKIQFMESERKTFWKDVSDRELISSSYKNSIKDQPVVINLSGEALDAYNEAYDELMKMNESEEADLTSGGKKSPLSFFDRNAYQGQNGKTSPELFPHEERPLDERILSRDADFSGDESDDGYDEVEKLLIKQILEKTMKGDSSVILNVEKGLFSVDEYEH